ncbi:hypothetical protein ACFQZC_22880 [Streptacidiphilus monticola]
MPTETGRSTGSPYSIRPGLPTEPPEYNPEATPDWPAKAAEFTATRRRRRARLRLTVTAAALLALLAGSLLLLLPGGSKSGRIAQPVATAPVVTGYPTPSQTPSATLLDPLTLLSSAATDTAPLSAEALFPAASVTVNGHSYQRVLTDAPACGQAATAPLAAVLVKNACRQVYRATYVSGGTAVTIGVAVFDDAAQAAAVKAGSTAGNLQSLYGGAAKPFCRGVVCRLSANAVGRYAYFTVAGNQDGKPVLPVDKVALAAGTDIAAATFQTLADRGRAEATQRG